MEPIPSEESLKKCIEWILQLEVNFKKPILPDPSLPQIPGYSHNILDEDTHQIVKCNDEGGVDDEFQPLKISYVDLRAMEFQLQREVVEKVTNFLKAKFEKNFNRLIQVEIIEVSDRGIGFEEMWRNIPHPEDLYFLSHKSWNPKDFHLYIIWRCYYRIFSGKKEDQDPKKMSDLTIGGDKPNKGSRLSEEGDVKREDGETVLCLPEGSLDNLTMETAISYLAAKSLLWTRLIPNGDNYIVKTPEDSMTPDAKERMAQIAASTRAKLEQVRIDIDNQFNKMITDTEGAVAKRKEELKRDFFDLRTLLKQLWNQAKEVVSRMFRLPQLSIVTTPTGPGVAINAIITEMDNLMALAAGLTALIEQIEAKTNKLNLEKYSKKISEIATVYAAVTNILNVAKTAVALIGKGV